MRVHYIASAGGLYILVDCIVAARTGPSARADHIISMIKGALTASYPLQGAWPVTSPIGYMPDAPASPFPPAPGSQDEGHKAS